MQNLKPGDLVRVRRLRWRVADVRAFDACQLVTLDAADSANANGGRRVIAPFDVVEPIPNIRRGRVVAPRRWRRACRDLIADTTPPGGLRAARHARMDLLPHQLEPALAIVRGIGSRALLADDVGLGKTLQAGLAIAELRARDAAERILILTPAGVREQWQAELANRLDIDAIIADAPGMRRRAAELPVGFNPWTVVPIAIASVDYVKRPEVLPALAACRWDAVVVDEAHNVAGDSARFRAVDTLASRAAYVLLLTATPHNGDRRAFVSLCGIGSREGDPLMIFRRTRQDVRIDVARRVHRLHVRPSPAERRMHALLARFSLAVRGERGDAAILALSVLHKRALSSARSLERSVERRLASLTPNLDRETAQLTLPLDDGEGEQNLADEVPAWDAHLSLADAARERQLLVELHQAARKASADESKIRVLRRLLRRIGEPSVVFTEYRDTLFHLRAVLDRPAAILHGGLNRDERTAALADFASGRRALLLATDAAGEGLNLHQQCRVVINLELPWNPMRLEQRIGRVDRIGQRRTVHAVHLIARDTVEARILGRLKERLARARMDIAMPDPLGGDEQSAIAALLDGRTPSAPGASARNEPPIPSNTFPSLVSEALAEVDRLARVRALAVDRSAVAERALWLMRARHWQTRALLRNRTLLLVRATIEDGDGRVAESTLLPVALPSNVLPLRALRNATTLAAIESALRSSLEAPLAIWHDHATSLAQAFIARRTHRERAIGIDAGNGSSQETQPGLFDRRVEHAAADAAAAEQERDERQRARLRALDTAADLRACEPRIVLAVGS